MSIDKDPTGKRARWILENWVIQHKDGPQHTNADALSRWPPDSEPQVVEDVSGRMTSQVNAVGSDTETVIVQTGTALPHTSSTSLQASDPVSEDHRGESVGKSDEISPMNIQALSHDRTQIKELQSADPDIRGVLDWFEKHGSRPPRRLIRGSSTWLQKLWTEFPRLSVVAGLLCRKVNYLSQGPLIAR